MTESERAAAEKQYFYLSFTTEHLAIALFVQKIAKTALDKSSTCSYLGSHGSTFVYSIITKLVATSQLLTRIPRSQGPPQASASQFFCFSDFRGRAYLSTFISIYDIIP